MSFAKVSIFLAVLTLCHEAVSHQNPPATRQESPWILSAVRRGRATAGKEVLREALLARLEDPRYLDSLVMRAAEKRLHHGKMDEHIFRDIARVREVMAAFLDSASSSRLAAKLDRAGIDDAERIAMEMSGEGTRLDRVLDGIPDGVLLDLVGAVLDNLGQTLEELIDYIASAVDGAVDNLFSEGGDALDQVLEDLGEDVMDLLELFKKSGYYGIPAQFNEDTRQALIDLRNDIHIIIIIVATCTALYSAMQVGHGVDQIFRKKKCGPVKLEDSRTEEEQERARRQKHRTDFM